MRSRRKWIIICFIIMLALATGFYIWKAKTSDSVSAGFSSLSKRMHFWLTERKTRLNQNLSQVKQLTANNQNANQEIHFEFYTTLPNMRVPVPQVEKTETTRPVIVMNNQATPEDKIKVIKIAEIKNFNTDNLFDQDKLQQSLKEEFNAAEIKDQYIVQIGVFKNAVSAEQLKQSFANAGFATRIIKINMNSGKAYSVQAGPFQKREQALFAQRELKTKNINGIIRKL